MAARSFQDSVRNLPQAFDKDPARATFEQYQEILEERPKKFSAAHVNYREADGEEQCLRCVHFFVGVAAGRNACEILRVPTETIDPSFTCDYMTPNGKDFPLLEEPPAEK